MRLREQVASTTMSRVAVVAPERGLRDALVVVADSGVLELAGSLPPAEGQALEALRRLERAASVNGRVEPRLDERAAEPARLEELGRQDLLTGEVELARRAAGAVRHGRFAAVVGWIPTGAVATLEERLAAVGAGLVELPAPAGPSRRPCSATRRSGGRFARSSRPTAPCATGTSTRRRSRPSPSSSCSG